MSPTFPLTTPAPQAPTRWPRRLAVHLLRRASRALDRAAALLLGPSASTARRRREFGADGAVYEDGELLGFLDGVRRL
ncbi:MAG TPA: hypothetical protein VLI72_13880 [Methylibium sp.]|nr:hypothetical protein [Methylibium sp.]